MIFTVVWSKYSWILWEELRPVVNYCNYSNLVRILIMKNSAHFGKNGVSNLTREVASNLVRIYGKTGQI